jgi:methyl acetate hydrolase
MILNRGRADGQQVLKPEAVQMMSTNQMGACRVGMVSTAMPQLSNDAGSSRGCPRSGVQLHDQHGASADRAQPRQPRLGRARQLLLLDDPAAGIEGVYATQVLPFADKALPLFLAFEKIAYDQLS